jgi:geranylgeranyl reductase family protein
LIYDVIVVGAGPAGSTAAREAAVSGATVLLLDRAPFPRDKPCGGGVNIRAARLLPFPLDEVTERTIQGIEVSLNLERRFTRRYAEPLALMTQRCRLDAYLVDKAIDSGVAFLDGVTVRSLEESKETALVRGERQAFRGRVIIGADGANGVVARAAGLSQGRRQAIALEGHYPMNDRMATRWSDRLAMDLGVIPGGYGWLFPKADHLNIGVGGWQHFGPSLRSRLDRIAAYFGYRQVRPSYLRGHRLPIRIQNAPLARGNVMLAGDAAGLIDPLSGEGIYAAIYSGRVAAREAQRFLKGESPDLLGYTRAIDLFLGPDLLASQRFQDVFHLMPAVYARMLRHSNRLWEMLCRLVRGETSYLELRRGLGPLALMVDGMSAFARLPAFQERLGLSAADVQRSG